MLSKSHRGAYKQSKKSVVLIREEAKARQDKGVDIYDVSQCQYTCQHVFLSKSHRGGYKQLEKSVILIREEAKACQDKGDDISNYVLM